MHTILFLILFVVSLGVSQYTTKDRVLILETKMEAVGKRMNEAEHDLDQYYHEVYIKGNKRRKEHAERYREQKGKLDNTNLQSIGTIIAGFLVVIWQALQHRKIKIIQNGGGHGN